MKWKLLSTVTLSLIAIPNLSFSQEERNISIFSEEEIVNEAELQRGAFVNSRNNKKVPNSLSDNLSEQEISHLALIYLYQSMDLNTHLMLVDLPDDVFEDLTTNVSDYFYSTLSIENEKSKLVCATYQEAVRTSFSTISEQNVLDEASRFKRSNKFNQDNILLLKSFQMEVKQQFGDLVLNQLMNYFRTYGDNFFYKEEKNSSSDSIMGIKRIDLIAANCK